MLKALKSGLNLLVKHSKLWLVTCLVFILPAIFLFGFQAIEKAAQANIKSVQVQRMSSFHDLTKLILSDPDYGDRLKALSQAQSDVTRLIVLKEEAGSFIRVYHSDSELIGTPETDLDGFQAAGIRPGETIIFELHDGVSRIWQAYRVIPESGYYILSEHNFSNLDALMKARWQEVYLILSLVFMFIIALAYWLMRQIDYERRYRALEAKLQARDLLTKGMVHELRAPLTAMRGYASLIEESAEVPAAARGYAGRIGESAARLVDLVSDFLAAAKVHANEMLVATAPVDINALLTRVISQYQAQAEAKGLALVRGVVETTEKLFTDDKRLEQILNNLLSNSIKYTDQGTVTISVDQNLWHTTIVVADTGSGMSASDQKKLFTPFVRVGDESTQHKVTGTGLGMWLTKEMVEQLGGTIGIESIKDLGTHVVVTLPNKPPKQN